MDDTNHAVFYRHRKRKAAERLASIAEVSEPETAREVEETLACILKHGDANERAAAIMAAAEWRQACNELKEHVKTED